MTQKPDKPGGDIDPELLRRNATRGLENADFEENEPRWGTARFNERTTLVIRVRGVAEPAYTFDATSVSELVMGRRSPDTSEIPDVNLEAYGAADKGVSRRHAVISRSGDSLYLRDAGSYNGTFLNGQKLVPHQPRVLRDGDDVRLGFLVLRVNFVRTPIYPADESAQSL